MGSCQTLSHHIPSTHHHHPQPTRCCRRHRVPLQVPIWAKQGLLTVEHHAHTSPPTPATTSRCISIFTVAINRHVTTVDNAQMLHHHHRWPPTPCHTCWQCPNTTSPMPATSDAMSPSTNGRPSPPWGMWAPKSTSREWGGVRWMGKGARRDGKGWQGCRGSNGGRGRLFEPPPSLSFIPEADEAARKPCTASFVLDYPPWCLGGTFHLQHRQWSDGIPTCCSILSIVDSVDGRGSFMLPPFLFFSNRGGGFMPPPFIFSIPPQMRGGFPPSSINERRRCVGRTLPPFLFISPLTVVRFPTPLNSGGISSLWSQQTGVVWNPHTTSVYLYFIPEALTNGGSVKPTHCLPFFLFTPLIWGVLPSCGVKKQGWHETHMPPPFFSFTPPPHWGYFPLY